MKQWALAVTVALLVAACGPGERSTGQPQATAPAQASRSGVSSVYLISTLDDAWGKGYDPRGLYLKPVDPLTGKDLPGYEPYHLGHDGGWAISPDGTALALTYEPHDGNGLHELTLFDLADWRPLTGPLLSAQSLVAHWSPDGSRIYVVSTDAGDPPKAFLVTIAAAANYRVLSRIPLPFSGSTDLSPDGRTLYLFGNDFHYDEVLPTRLIAIDASSGMTRDEVDWPELPYGEKAVTDSAGSQCYASYSGTGVLSPDGSSYFVFHPDADVVTVVDTATMRVSAATPIRERRSALRQLLSRLARTAEADEGIVFSHGALLSPDGRSFYRLKSPETQLQCPIDSQPASEKPVMQVIDASSFEIAREVPMPDDLGYGYRQMRFDATGRYLYAFHLLDFVVIDARTMQIIARRPAYPAGDVVVAP